MYLNSGVRISFKAPSPLTYVGVVVSVFGPRTLLRWPTPSHSLPWPSDSCQSSHRPLPRFLLASSWAPHNQLLKDIANTRHHFTPRVDLVLFNSSKE